MRPDPILSVTGHTVSGAMITDEVFVMELWGPDLSVSYPIRADVNCPQFEGGYVTSVTDYVVSLNASQTRQAINPQDGSPNYATALVANAHIGRQVLVWHAGSSNAAGEVRTITQNTNYTVTLDTPIPNLAAGDLLIICDQLKAGRNQQGGLTAVSSNWDIDSVSGSASFTFQTNIGDPVRRISARSWLYWRKRCWDLTGNDTGWLPYGLWCASQPQIDEENASLPVTVTATDATRLAATQPIVNLFQSDILTTYPELPGQDTCVPLKMVADGSGDAQIMRFFDSPEVQSNPVRIMANHTTNWCSEWPIELFASQDQNYSITTAPASPALPDIPINVTPGTIQVLYGGGEVRISGTWYRANMSTWNITGALAMPGPINSSSQADLKYIKSGVPSQWYDPAPIPFIMGWVQPNALPPAGQSMTVGSIMYYDAGSNAYLYITPDGKLNFTQSGYSDSVTATSTATITCDGLTWTHVAGGMMKVGGVWCACVWINGVRVNATPDTKPQPGGYTPSHYCNYATVGGFYLDNQPTEMQNCFFGALDEIVLGMDLGPTLDVPIAAVLTDILVEYQYAHGPADDDATRYSAALSAGLNLDEQTTACGAPVYNVWHFTGAVDQNGGTAYVGGIPSFVAGIVDPLDPIPTKQRPYLKARYARWCSPSDLRTGGGPHLTISGTTITCTDWTGAMELPVYSPTGPTYKSLAGRTLRFLTGKAKGLTATILPGNTSDSVTISVDPTLSGAADGDTVQIGGINDPKEMLETCMLQSGYQVCDPNRPLYMSDFDQALLPDTAAAIYASIGGVLGDYTTLMSNASLGATLTLAPGDWIAVGHTYPMGYVWWEGTGDGLGDVLTQYWGGTPDGGAWLYVPEMVGQTFDQTGGFVQTGLMGFARPPKSYSYSSAAATDWSITQLSPSVVYPSGTPQASGQLFWVRFINEGGRSTTINTTLLQPRERAQMKSPEQYIEQQNKHALDVFHEARNANVLPPNWIFRAAPSGNIVAQTAVQQANASWATTSAMRIRKTNIDQDLVTKCLYTGYSDNWTNIAITSNLLNPDGTPINLKLTEDAGLIAEGLARAYSNQHVGVNEVPGTTGYGDISMVLAAGNLSITPIPDGTISPVDGKTRGYWGCWQYFRTVDYPGSQAPIDNVPLWTLDFGEVQQNLNEVHLWTNDVVKPETNAKPLGVPPILALEVSSDGSNWYWLSNSTMSIQMSNAAFLDSRFTSGDAGWQSSWQYLRCRCIRSGLYGSSGHNRSYTGCVCGLMIYQNNNIMAKIELGKDAPFTAQTYVDRRRRYGVVLDSNTQVDYTAQTIQQVKQRAIARLTEFAAQLPELVVDVARPDVALLETAAVTWPAMGYTNRPFMVIGMSAAKGAQVSVKMRDMTIEKVAS